MARMRTVKPEFWVDDKVVDLSVLAKLLFIGLWNFADDEGYLEASPRRIKRQVFPDNDYDVAGALNELRLAGMVRVYLSDQGELLHIVHFRDHQKPQHPTPTKYTNVREPSPDYMIPHEESGELVSPHPVVESSSSGGKSSVTPRVTESDFENAYSHWPKKTERKKSFEKFRKVAAERGLDVITADVIRYGDAYTRSTEKQFVPALVVWLNGERWDDELPGSSTTRPYVTHKPAPNGQRYAVDVAMEEFLPPRREVS